MGYNITVNQKNTLFILQMTDHHFTQFSSADMNDTEAPSFTHFNKLKTLVIKGLCARHFSKYQKCHYYNHN